MSKVNLGGSDAVAQEGDLFGLEKYGRMNGGRSFGGMVLAGRR